jgi:hypothetical protein
VRAAVAAGAPRRTVAAAAAAVASAMAAGRGGDRARAGASEPSAVSGRRRKKNRRKKERRKAAMAGEAEVAHEVEPDKPATRSRPGVGAGHSLEVLAAVSQPPPLEPPPRPDATMCEDGEPTLMAAPMSLSPANLVAFGAQQFGQAPRHIDFDAQSQRSSLQSQQIRGLLGLHSETDAGSHAGENSL